jgi:hypothetical protein
VDPRAGLHAVVRRKIRTKKWPLGKQCREIIVSLFSGSRVTLLSSFCTNIFLSLLGHKREEVEDD